MLLKKSGFTLVELIAVVAVMAIISMAGVASFSVVGQRQLESESKRLVSDLCWVREMAATQRHNYIVVFDTAARSYRIYQDSVGAGNLLRTRTLSADIVSVTPAPQQLLFSLPFGKAEDKQITLRYQGRTVQIQTFSQTGYVRIL